MEHRRIEYSGSVVSKRAFKSSKSHITVKETSAPSHNLVNFNNVGRPREVLPPVALQVDVSGFNILVHLRRVMSALRLEVHPPPIRAKHPVKVSGNATVGGLAATGHDAQHLNRANHRHVLEIPPKSSEISHGLSVLVLHRNW